MTITKIRLNFINNSYLINNMIKHKNFIFVLNFQLTIKNFKKKLQITKFKWQSIKILKKRSIAIQLQ